MSDTTHTPGPWFRAAHDDLAIRADSGEQADRVLAEAKDVYAFDNYQPEETVANARLIAAAPELLAACEGIMKELERGLYNGGTSTTYSENCRKAIVKATGENND